MPRFVFSTLFNVNFKLTEQNEEKHLYKMTDMTHQILEDR
jgi:hypothetical protein